MAEKKVIEIEVNTKGAVKSMDALGKATNDVSKSFADVYGDLQPLTTRMGEAEDRLYELANAGKTTSQEYKVLLKSVGVFRKVQISTDMAVDAAATTFGQKLGGALGGVSSGFTAVSGVMGAFGTQSEEVEKALLKVQSAMAIQQGIQGIKESVSSFRELKAVVVSALTSMTAAKVLNNTANEAGLIVENQTILSKGKNLIISGIQATLTSVLTAAQYAYNLAMSLNPVMIIVVAVTALIAAGYALINMFNDSAEAEEKQNASIKKNTKALETQIKTNEKASKSLKTKNEHEYKMAEASGASADALHKLAIRHANEEIALERASKATAHNTYIKERNTLAYLRSIDASDEVIKKQEALTTAARENSVKEGKDLSAALENKATLLRDNEVRIASDKHKSSSSNHEKTTKTEKTQAKEKLDITKNVEDENIRLMDEGQKKEEAIILLAYKRKKEEQDKNLKDKVLKQVDYDTLQKLNKEGQEADILAIEQKYILQAEEARKTAQEKKDAEFLRQENLLAELTDTAQQKLYDKYKIEQEAAAGNDALLLALKNKYEKDKEALDKEAADKEIATAKEVAEKKADILQQQLTLVKGSFQAFADVATLFAGKNKKAQKTAFNIQKAANIASATIDTYTAATAAFKSVAGIPIVGPALGAIAAAGAVAVGVMNIKKIAASKFEGGGTPSGGGGGGGGGGGATAPTMSAPQFNVVGQSGVNQLASLNQQPVQAYVVSGQVTSQQALDRNRLANATLGG